MRCRNCGQEGPHFVPPSFGEEGFYHCQQQRVVAAAIVYKGVTYSLAPPARHHDVIQMIVRQTGEGSIGENEQGFLDNYGTFLRRKPARIVAERAGQILKNDAPQLDDLYSENVW